MMIHEQHSQHQRELIHERLDATFSNTYSKRKSMPQLEPSSSPRKRRRTETRVCFPDKEISETAPSVVLNEDEWHNLWYHNEDISIFRKDALNYIKGIPVAETRGLERFQWTRAKDKSEARRCTLKAYRSGIRGNKFAEVVQIFTANARSEAFVTGCNDYCEAYHPEMKDALVGLDMKFLKQQDETDKH